jgi:hypothetical protein
MRKKTYQSGPVNGGRKEAAGGHYIQRNKPGMTSNAHAYFEFSITDKQS